MIIKNDAGEDVNLDDLFIVDISEIIEQLYENYHATKDRALRKELKQRYVQLVEYYNKRAAFKCYSDTLK